MPTQLTIPITSSETSATLDGWELVVRRTPDLQVDPANSMFLVELAFRDSNGVVKRTVRVSRDGASLPVGIRNAIGNLQSTIITFLRAQSILPPGSDVSDF